MKPTKKDLYEWIKENYGNDWSLIMSEQTDQSRRLKADENDVDKMLRKKYPTKDDLIDYIYTLSEEGQKFLEDNRIINI